MAPESEAQDFVELLEEELATCVMPSIKDPGKATVEDLVRDMHRMMVGNGNPTKGIIFKVASANVRLTLLRDDVKTVEDRLDKQVKTCSTFRGKLETDKAVEEAEQTTVKRIGKAIWANKGLIIILVLSAMVYAINALGIGAGKAADKAVERKLNVSFEQRLSKLLDAKIEQIVLEKSSK
jgi:hypothetical protein